MCGIAGIFRFHGPGNDRDLVQDMLGPLHLRGPDGEGIEQDGELTLGHRRLAVLDRSAAARQPMRTPGGRFLITYNGEIYNFREIQRQLGPAAEQLRTRSDTEVLLRAWERWGPGVLDRLVGEWAFALFDTEERRLWLCRDRFGEKPLFYHTGPGALSFASTIRALVQVPWVSRELDPEALAEYLTIRYVVSPRTILASIRKLPPGHLLSAGADGVTVRRWYDPRFHRRRDRVTAGERCNLIDEFGVLLDQASRRCLVSDVPVALLLSDGIDSNSIGSTLSRSGHAVPTFTYRRVGPTPEDPGISGTRRTGADAADLCVTLEDQYRHLVPAFSSFTEPVGDGASLATWLLIRGARPHATVFLSGSGGDEVLGGYRLDLDLFRLAAARSAAWLPESLLKKALDGRAFWRDLAIRRKMLRAAPGRRGPAIARYLVNRPLPASEVDDLFRPAPTPGKYLEAIDRLYDECAEDATALDRIQEVMFRTFLSENVLSHSDSVAMGSSAEMRLPFLDRDLVEFVLRLPPCLRARSWPWRDHTKVILRQWAGGLLWPRNRPFRKRTFRYGSIRHLLTQHGGQVRDLVLGAGAIRRALAGLEDWIGRPPEVFHRTREGTAWALLALGIWCEAIGVR